MNEQYKGMTVNERLYFADLIASFDEALKKKDFNSIISILEKVELDGVSVNSILKHYGLEK